MVAGGTSGGADTGAVEAGLSELKPHVSPTSHVSVIDVLGQRMSIITPFNASNPVCEYIRTVRLIPSDNISVLLCKLAEV